MFRNTHVLDRRFVTACEKFVGAFERLVDGVFAAKPRGGAPGKTPWDRLKIKADGSVK